MTGIAVVGFSEGKPMQILPCHDEVHSMLIKNIIANDNYWAQIRKL